MRAKRDAFVSSLCADRLRLKTWNPPESVRIGCGQDMNSCKPPMERISSWPGRKYKMVSITEENLDAQIFKLLLGLSFHRRRRANRHEGGSFDHAVRSCEAPEARAGRDRWLKLRIAMASEAVYQQMALSPEFRERRRAELACMDAPGRPGPFSPDPIRRIGPLASPRLASPAARQLANCEKSRSR